MEQLTAALQQANSYSTEARNAKTDSNLQDSFLCYAQSVKFYIAAFKLCTGPLECFASGIQKNIQHDNEKSQQIRSMIFGSTSSGSSTSSAIARDFSSSTEKRPANITNDNSTQNFRQEFASLILDVSEANNFDSIIGMTAVKYLMYDLILKSTKYSVLMDDSEMLGQNQNMLLFGLPGMGKTCLAKAFAAEAKMYKFIEVSGSQLLSKWIGESEKKLQALFYVAENNGPTILFIDEIDGLLGVKEDSATHTVVNEFLIQVEKSTKIIVIGATNHPWALMPSVRRRFGYVIYIPLPVLQERIELMKYFLKDRSTLFSDFEYSALAKKIKGYSSSDIKRCMQYARSVPWIKVRYSDYFSLQPSSSSGSPNTSKWYPCNRTAPGSVKMSYVDIDASEIGVPLLQLKDLEFAISQIKRTVDIDDVQKNSIVYKTQEFRKKYAQDPGKGAQILLNEL